jgi:hypothetical protein
MFSAFRLGTETNDGNDHWEGAPTRLLAPPSIAITDALPRHAHLRPGPIPRAPTHESHCAYRGRPTARVVNEETSKEGCFSETARRGSRAGRGDARGEELVDTETGEREGRAVVGDVVEEVGGLGRDSLRLCEYLQLDNKSED